MASGLGMTSAPMEASERRLTAVGIVHLVVGAAMTLLIVVWHPHEGDPLPFLSTAQKIAAGGVPYRDVTSEYPPLALLNMTLPRILGGTSSSAYQTWFSVLSILLAIATLAIVYWLARRAWSVELPYDTAAMFIGLSLAAVPIVVWRFDILPAFFTVLALAAWAAGRAGWTGFGLGAGVMAKIYPVFLGPVFFLAAVVERRFKDALWVVAGGAVAVGLILAGPVLVAGDKAFSYVLYQQDRGVEIEAVAGGLAMLAHTVASVPARVALGFGAWQISSPALSTLATPVGVFNVVIVAFVVIACLLAFRRDVREYGSVQPTTLVTYLTATLLAVILINKVLSPQYLVWLLPFVALLPGSQSLFLLGVLVLTTFIYPLNFAPLIDMRWQAVIALNIRNLLLLVLLIWVAWPRDWRMRERAAPGSERGYVRDPAY